METMEQSPLAAAAVYSPQDHDKVAAINKWLQQHDKPRAWLGKKAAIPNGTLSQIMSGKYVSSPSKQLDLMVGVLHMEAARMKDGTPGYHRGSVHKLMEAVFDRMRKHQSIGVVTGYVGVGKTRFGKEYRASHPMTLFVETNPNMTPGVLLSELLAQLNVAEPVGLDRKFREICRVVKGTHYLLVVDEAERLSSSAMEYLRRIHDIAEVGVVLTGTEKLTALIKRSHGQIDQVRSRVGMWPMTIECITRDDADEIVRKVLAAADGAAQDAELSDGVLNALWAYCEGSARVLVEALLPALRDYATQGQAMTEQLVHSVAQTVLFMVPRSTKGGAV